MKNAAAVALGGILALSRLSLAAGPTREVTFTKDIAPILQEKCQECHRNGSMAPMSLVTYEETRPWAKSIKQRVVTPADAAVAHRQDGRSPEVQERHVAERRADRRRRPLGGCGRAAGRSERHAAAQAVAGENEWKAAQDLGPPDFVIKSEPYTMAAHHQDVWWRPVSDIPVTEPRWVRAVEMRPGTLAGRKITHHAVAYLAQDDPETFGPGGDAGPARASDVDGMGGGQGL